MVLNCFYGSSRLHNCCKVTLLVFLCCVAIVFPSAAFLRQGDASLYGKHGAPERFITDVSHELKTPLGIISANMGVLEIVNGKDEWIESTQNQVRRLDG